MDLTSFVVDVVVFLVIASVVISVVRALRAWPARVHLTPLSAERRTRYMTAWERIEKRFMDAPEEAVQEADSLSIALLGERGHPLGKDSLPRQLRAARRKMAEGERRHRTEDLRQALLDYRTVVSKMIGPEAQEPFTEGRRETA